MKRTKIIASILTLCMGIFALTYGVYAAQQITATVTATVSFTTSNIFVNITGYVTGATTDGVAACPETQVFTAAAPKAIYTASTTDPNAGLTPTEGAVPDPYSVVNAWEIGDIYFSNSAYTEIVFSFTVTRAVAGPAGKKNVVTLSGGDGITGVTSGGTVTGDLAAAANSTVTVTRTLTLNNLAQANDAELASVALTITIAEAVAE